MLMSADDRHTYSLGGGTKTKAKTCHSSTVKIAGLQLYLPHLVALIFPLSLKFASVCLNHTPRSCASLAVPSCIYSSLVSSYPFMLSLHECCINWPMKRTFLIVGKHLRMHLKSQNWCMFSSVNHSLYTHCYSAYILLNTALTRCTHCYSACILLT